MDKTGEWRPRQSRRRAVRGWTLGVLALLVHTVGPASAQDTPGSDADLAKQLSNPVSSLVSVPLQFNWDQPVGVDHDTRMIMNFQPVVPFSLNANWNLILRWIMPYIAQPRLFDGAVPTSGLGDITTSVFFSPTRPGKFIWGLGPVLQLPVTADPVLGSAKWSGGPTIVVVKQAGHVTYGALANQLWSFAGDDFSGGVTRTDVNATFLQPFVSLTTANAVTYGVNLEAQANWNADDAWTIPMNVTISKLTRFGPYPMSIGGGVGIYMVAPGEPDWKLRFTATLLLPGAR